MAAYDRFLLNRREYMRETDDSKKFELHKTLGGDGVVSDNSRGKKDEPHVTDVLNDKRLLKLYLPIYAILAVVILWIYPSDWLGFLFVFGFGFLVFGRLNKLFSGSDWSPRDDKENQGHDDDN